jgi:hypothetical protein
VGKNLRITVRDIFIQVGAMIVYDGNSSIGNLNIMLGSLHSGFANLCEVNESRSHIRIRIVVLRLSIAVGVELTPEVVVQRRDEAGRDQE